MRTQIKNIEVNRKIRCQFVSANLSMCFFFCSALDYVTLNIKEGQDKSFGGKLSVEVNCFARKGWSFNRFNLTIQVTQFLTDNESWDMSQPFPGSVSKEGNHARFIFFVGRGMTYVVVLFGQYGKGHVHKLLAVPMRYGAHISWPAMQWHAYKRFFAFLSGNLTPLFLRLQYILNVFKFRSFVTSLSLLIVQKLTPENVLGVSILPPIFSKRDET